MLDLFNLLPFCLFICLLRQSYISHIVSQWLTQAYAVGIFSQHLTSHWQIAVPPSDAVAVSVNKSLHCCIMKALLNKHSPITCNVILNKDDILCLRALWTHLVYIAWQLCISSHQHLRCSSQESGFHYYYFLTAALQVLDSASQFRFGN